MFNRLDCPADSHETNATETHPWLTRGPQGQPFQCKVRRSRETSGPEAGSAKEPGDLCIDRNAWNEWATSGPVRPCAGQTSPGPSGPRSERACGQGVPASGEHPPAPAPRDAVSVTRGPGSTRNAASLTGRLSEGLSTVTTEDGRGPRATGWQSDACRGDPKKVTGVHTRQCPTRPRRGKKVPPSRWNY